jgi:cytosine/adenosine deaminase-related metal-dependent hydrolase
MIFDNATIITINPKREIIRNGSVVVEGKNIIAIGKSREIREQYPDHKVTDCNGNVLMPGLIDTHVHTAQAMLRGCADDLALLDWLGKRVWVLQGNYSEEDGIASASLCALEMIKSGTTAFIECMLAERYGFDGVAQVIARSGMRAAIGKIIMDQPSYGKKKSFMHPGLVEDGETSIRNTLSAYDKWNGAADGRIQVWFGPRTPGGVTPEIYDEISRLARARNMGITIHNSEVRDDLAYATAQGFRSPVEFVQAHGLLGPRTVLAHCVWTDKEDWKILAKTGTHVAHNPASNAKLASGIAPVVEMLKAHVNVTLGCDGGPSNNTYDMVRDMRLACYLAKLRQESPTVLPAEAVLEMATINGAKALGLADQIGSIEAGKRADFIIIKMDAPHLTPAWDPVSTIAYAATGTDVSTVVIDGRIIMHNRKVRTLQEEEILADVRSRYLAVAKRGGLEISPRWPLR